MTQNTRRQFLRWGLGAGAAGFAGCPEIDNITQNQSKAIPTSLTLNLPPETTEKRVIFRGQLADQRTGSGISNQEIIVVDKGGGLSVGDNQLASGRTSETGDFVIPWTANQIGSSKDVEIYAKFDGASSYDSSRFPDGQPYPIRVDNQITPFDFKIGIVPTTDTIIRGFPLKYYIVPFAKNKFQTDPSADMPAASLQVDGVPNEAVELNPQSEQLLTNFPGYLNPSAAVGYVSELEFDSTQLSPQEHSFKMIGKSIHIRRATSSRDFRVVEPSVDGARYYVYDMYSKMVIPRWWVNSAIAKLLKEGVTDPVGYIINTLFEVVEGLVSGSGPTKVALQELTDVFEETLVPLLETLSKTAVGDTLARSANEANIDTSQLVQNLRHLPEFIAKNNKSEARDALTQSLEIVREWKNTMDAMDFDGASAETASVTLSTLITLLEADQKSVSTPDRKQITMDRFESGAYNDGDPVTWQVQSPGEYVEVQSGTVKNGEYALEMRSGQDNDNHAVLSHHAADRMISDGDVFSVWMRTGGRAKWRLPPST